MPRHITSLANYSPANRYDFRRDREEDWADRHVARWRDHWIDVAFEDDVEAIVVRIGRLSATSSSTTQQALVEVGLQDFEYDTLHHLMIRDTPGLASPSALADDLGISNAGMTGRLDSLEKAGWIQRSAGRRRPAPGRASRSPRAARRSGAGRWTCAAGPRTRSCTRSTPTSARRWPALLKKMTLVTEPPRATFFWVVQRRLRLITGSGHTVGA